MAESPAVDLFYNRAVGSGMITSKFRFSRNPAAKPKAFPLQLSTHSLFNCTRCYRLKKRCSRDKPICGYCNKTGASCEYVDRPTKRKRDSPKAEPDVPSPTGSNSVSIASLVHEGEQNHRTNGDDSFRNIDLPSSVALEAAPAAPAKKSRAKHFSKPCSTSFNSKLVLSQFRASAPQNLQEEYLVIKAIADDGLPSAFVHTFFSNYEWKYPFLQMPAVMQKFNTLSFTRETLVNLDTYLIMATGCVIFDANNGTHHYREYFSDSLIESIVDIISFDVQVGDDWQTVHLLLLLAIYAVNASNVSLVWNILGFLNRLVIFLTDFALDTPSMPRRCFWSIFNLDKELLLVLQKPSQFIPWKIIRTPRDFGDTLVEGEPEYMASLMAQTVTIHQLQDRMLHLRLGLVDSSDLALKEFSADLEKWRVEALLIIHRKYADLHLLQNFVGLINLDYYYLLIELDQLSSTESFQFTLQFLSNSFSLVLTSSDKKGAVGTSLYSLFWFQKFFNVISFNLYSLQAILRGGDGGLQQKLAEFNSNIQLMVNLIKLLLNSHQSPAKYVTKLQAYVTSLGGLSVKLMGVNGNEKEKLGELADEVNGIIIGKS